MKTADPELMRAINRFHVMDAIRRFGPISRVEISQFTELSPTTVSAITAALLDDRLIIPLPVGAVRDAARGRPRVMLKLNPDAAFVVGVKLAPDQITVAVDQFLRRRAADALPCRSASIARPRAVIADLVEDGVRRCVSDADSRWQTSPASASACPASSSAPPASAGRARSSRERDVTFGADLTQRLGVAGRRSTATSISSRSPSIGSARRASSTIFSSSASNTFLGLGIMHNGELFRGANGLSPDLGDVMVRPPRQRRRPARRLASEASVLDEVEAPLRGTEHEAAFRAGRGMALVLQLAAEGDQRCIGILAAAGEALGFAIANLITLFAPPKVFSPAARWRRASVFIGPLRETRRGPAAAESRRCRGHRRARMERRHLGRAARRR